MRIIPAGRKEHESIRAGCGTNEFKGCSGKISQLRKLETISEACKWERTVFT